MTANPSDAAKASAVDIIRAKLAETGMSQTELARRAGLERSHISELLAGRCARFSVERINRALAVFGVQIEATYRITGIGPESEAGASTTFMMR